MFYFLCKGLTGWISEISKVLILNISEFGDYGFEIKKFKAYGIDCTGILGFRVLKFGVLRLLGVRNLECGI